MKDIIYKFILSFLGIIIITIFISITFKKIIIDTTENFDLGGSIRGVFGPGGSIDSGLNELKNKMEKYVNAIGDFFNIIKKDLEIIPQALGDQLDLIGENTNEDLGAFGDSFENDMKMIFVYLGDIVINLSESFICAAKKIEDFPTCFKYYFVYVFAKTIYLPISILVNIFRLKSLETSFFQFVDKFDCFIYDLFGFYLFHFSEEIQRKCFICEMNFPSPPNASDFHLSNFSFPNDFSNLSDPFDNLIDPTNVFDGLL